MTKTFSTFGKCWQRILLIAPGTIIEARNIRGAACGQFVVAATSNDSVRVRAESLGLRRIPRSEFDVLFQRLQERPKTAFDLRSTSPHSEYVLGILHHVVMTSIPGR